MLSNYITLILLFFYLLLQFLFLRYNKLNKQRITILRFDLSIGNLYSCC